MNARPILVVDDDDDVRTMLCVILSAEGYDTVSAADGMEALERMRHEPPALVLIDLMMPRMNGEDLIRTMKQDASLEHIPVAVLSGQAPGATASVSPQVVACLAKPVELDELVSVVHRLVT